MFLNSVGAKSSGKWASAQDIVASTSQTGDTSSGTDDASYVTGNEDQIESSTVTSALTPPLPPGPQLGTDKLSENKFQSGHPLPPLVPVRRPSQSQLNVRAQSTTTHPPVVPQNVFTPVSHTPTPANSAVPQGGQQPSQYAQDSHHIPIGQTYSLSTSGDISASFPGTAAMPYQSLYSHSPPSLTPQQYATPHRQSPLHTSSTYAGILPQPYGCQSAFTPQSHSSGHTRPQSGPPQSAPPQSGSPQLAQSAPPRSRLYSLPTPQAPSTTSQPFRRSQSQSYGPQFGYVPSRQPFVANDPFRVSHGDNKVDAPSDGLTFDNIPTAGPAPGPRFYQGVVNGSYSGGALPSQPTFGGNLSNNAPPPGTHEQSHSNQLGTYTPSHNAWQPEGAPEPQIQLQMPSNAPPTGSSEFEPSGPEHSWTPTPYHDDWRITPPVLRNELRFPKRDGEDGDDASAGDDEDDKLNPPLASPMPSTQHSPANGPKPDDYVTPLPAVPADRPSPPQDIPSTQYSPQTEADQSSFVYVHNSPSTPPLPSTPSSSYLYQQPQGLSPPIDPKIEWLAVALKSVLVTVPEQLYLHILLRLPSLYFSRVARIFEEADMTLPELKKMALETNLQFDVEMAFESTSVPPAYKKLTSTWEFFIDSVMREWKTFNIISVLLLRYVSSSLLAPDLILISIRIVPF